MRVKSLELKAGTSRRVAWSSSGLSAVSQNPTVHALKVGMIMAAHLQAYTRKPMVKRVLSQPWLPVAAILYFGMSLVTSRTQSTVPTHCEGCTQRLYGTIYVSDDPVRKVKRHYCKPCSESKELCWACGLPAPGQHHITLDDNRILCRLDSHEAVVSPAIAEQLFFQYLREWQHMLSPWPPVPNHNIKFHLVNQDDYLREYRSRPHLDNPEAIQGLTHTFKTSDGKLEHHIYILSGLLKNQFLAVCAHEFAHTWLYEHDNPIRQLHKDTVEGFCEWLAYKYVTKVGDKIETGRILGNRYTRGQVHGFIAAEGKFEFYRTMQWTLDGVDSWIDKRKLDRILVLRASTTPPAPFEPLPTSVVLTEVPDKLTLKGIANAGQRRFALINNATLSEGEQGTVRVGQQTVQIRCLSIRDRSVLIQAEGGNPEELYLAVDLKKK